MIMLSFQYDWNADEKDVLFERGFCSILIMALNSYGHIYLCKNVTLIRFFVLRQEEHHF